MADATTLFGIDNTQDYNVTAKTFCVRIVIQENYSSTSPPTQDLLQKIPASAANAVSIPKGTPAIYTPQGRGNNRFAQYSPGDVVGTIRTAAGSVTVQQIEGFQV